LSRYIWDTTLAPVPDDRRQAAAAVGAFALARGLPALTGLSFPDPDCPGGVGFVHVVHHPYWVRGSNEPPAGAAQRLRRLGQRLRLTSDDAARDMAHTVSEEDPRLREMGLTRNDLAAILMGARRVAEDPDGPPEILRLDVPLDRRLALLSLTVTAWAEETGLPDWDLVAYVLTGRPPTFRPFEVHPGRRTVAAGDGRGVCSGRRRGSWCGPRCAMSGSGRPFAAR
jgi:hypothetical protein